jgi:hypothetical protein
MSEAPVLSSKADFLSWAVPDRELVEVTKPNGEKLRIWVRGFTADEDDRLGIIRKDEGAKRNMLAMMAALVIVNENGERIYADTDKDALSKMSVRVLGQIIRTANRLSASTPESRADLGKGSAATGDAASSSG